ncbi:hypothetical protein PPERSA_12305 [Pseudocohnilembus persalinus]|uniref:Uncharacterized protein n=1 Tax=Pseudocohnilembus persalinus TaxID=266149 RepID=A0A0V0R5B4_PSEPJ|nr:hypothetical protein PPERSA_12305 [Pseudocohnilembus persalinus]|eukprot:KRX09562.1 hypothetical protein PPERSA_12305 [Pseudocohnilembus persalinus]
MTAIKKSQIQKAPFFIQTKNAQDMQELIYDTITYINEQPIFIGDRQETAPGLEFMPDGAVTFIEANDKKLKYNIQINDCSISLLHRNNGVTKFLYYIDGKPQNYLDVPIGQIHFQDIINKAYINQLNDKVHILSSVVRMPSENQEDDLLNKLLSYTASALIPLNIIGYNHTFFL